MQGLIGKLEASILIEELKGITSKKINKAITVMIDGLKIPVMIIFQEKMASSAREQEVKDRWIKAFQKIHFSDMRNSLNKLIENDRLKRPSLSDRKMDKRFSKSLMKALSTL